MKLNVFCYFITLISLNGLSHANYLSAPHKRFKRTDETSTQLSLGPKEKEALQEALEILNMGKHSLNLPTEDTQLLLQLVDVAPNDTDKSDQIEKFVEGDDHYPYIGKEYLALSGDNGQVRVDNFSLVTPGPASTNNNVEVQDVFKMVVRKKVPGSKDNAAHKISIVETNWMEPLVRMEYPQSQRRRRSDVWPLFNSLAKPRVRKKRTKDDPLLRFIRGAFSAKDIDEIFADKGGSGRRTITIRKLSEKEKFHGNNPFRKKKFDVSDNKRHAGNKFQDTVPWSRSRYRLDPPPEKTETFHTKREANKHRKFFIPFSDLQSSNWQRPLKLKSRLDDEYVDDVLKTSNSDKNVDIDKILSYGGLGNYLVTTKAHTFSTSGTTRTQSLPKRSLFKKNASSASPNPNGSSMSYTTESEITLQQEKYGQNPVIALDKNDFDKYIIFPSEDSTKETKSSSISEVAIVVIISLFCFATVSLLCSIAVRWHTQKTCCSTLELKGHHVTVTIGDDSLANNHNMVHQLPFKSQSGFYYRKMAVQEDGESEFDLPDFEWQSEVGEWLSDQGSVRQAIAFEEL